MTGTDWLPMQCMSPCTAFLIAVEWSEIGSVRKLTQGNLVSTVEANRTIFWVEVFLVHVLLQASLRQATGVAHWPQVLAG